MRLLNESNIWQNIQQRVQKAQDLLSKGRENDSYIEMIKALEEKGYQKNSLNVLVPYFRLNGKETRHNKLFNLLNNSNIIYDRDALEAIGQIVSYSKFETKDLQKIISSDDPKIIKALYYAKNKGMDLELLMDGKKPKTANKIVNLINRYLDSRQTRQDKKNKIDPLKFTALGYDIDDISKSINKINQNNLKNILYIKALGLTTDQTKDAYSAGDISNQEIEFINNLAYKELPQYWSDKLGVEVKLNQEQLMPGSKILDATLITKRNLIFRREKERIKKLLGMNKSQTSHENKTEDEEVTNATLNNQ